MQTPMDPGWSSTLVLLVLLVACARVPASPDSASAQPPTAEAPALGVHVDGVRGDMPRELVQDVLARRLAGLDACALSSGEHPVTFAIDRGGLVESATGDPCVVDALRAVRFPGSKGWNYVDLRVRVR